MVRHSVSDGKVVGSNPARVTLKNVLREDLKNNNATNSSQTRGAVAQW